MEGHVNTGGARYGRLQQMGGHAGTVLRLRFFQDEGEKIARIRTRGASKRRRGGGTGGCLKSGVGPGDEYRGLRPRGVPDNTD